MSEGIFDSGVVTRIRDDYKVTDLPETVGVNQSLLNAPIYVLNPKAANKLKLIEVSWNRKIPGNKEECRSTFRFIRAATDPLPTVTHAKYLDIILSMFSQNWNIEGVLHFRYSDVLRIAGKAKDSRSREAIQQMILRYHRHVTEWENCWQNKTDRVTFNIIHKSSVLDEVGDFNHKNPGSSKRMEDWHTVVFHDAVVKALKDEKKRILLTELFQKLKHDTFCVYRYYYGYPDYFMDNGIRRSNLIWRNLDALKEVFKWTGQKNRFPIWLKGRFSELIKLQLIDEPIWKGDAVGIHCKNLKEIQNDSDKVAVLSNYAHIDNIVLAEDVLAFRDTDTSIKIPPSAKRNRISKGKKIKTIDISNMTDEAIISEYYVRKKAGLVPAEKEQAIDLLLQNKLTDSAIGIIKSHALTIN